MAQSDFAERLDIDGLQIEYTDVMTGDKNRNRFLYYQLKMSMLKANKIDIIVSFLMESGVRMILKDLKAALDRGVQVRILTGNYLGITQPSALCLIKKILRGMYRYRNGEEQIVLDNGKYVKMNFSSSGQQECVWILNLLFYYLLQSKPYMFIIEEPESHLFPESQKYITEFIALVSNCGHSVLVTTHSPYVLGTLNNLLYAHDVGKQNVSEAGKIIPESFWLDYRRFDSWFVKEGSIENCMDMEIHMIQNERIDEISKVINYDFDELLKLQNTDEGIR